MIDVVLQSGAKQVDERHLWLPPQGLRRYQLAKVGVSVLMVAILAGWMVLQWQSQVSRLISGGLLVATIWIVAVSIDADLRRTRGRQMAIEDGRICLMRPNGHVAVPLAQVAYAQWIAEPAAQAGLWLYDKQAHPLLHIDAAFLADEAEARTFLVRASGVFRASSRVDTRYFGPSCSPMMT